MPDPQRLLAALTDDDGDIRQQAYDELLALDEDVVHDLVEVFYAGVNERTGLLILRLLSEIGGPEALNLLRDIFYFHERYPAWKAQAGQGLACYAHSLSPMECSDLVAVGYLDDGWSE